MQMQLAIFDFRSSMIGGADDSTENIAIEESASQTMISDSTDLASTDAPFADVSVKEISSITYNDNSASPDTPVETYTDIEEISRIIGLFQSLVPTEWDGTYQEIEPGNYCSYTVIFLDGSTKKINRSGDYVYFEDRRYQKGAFARQLHKDSAELYIDDSIGMPDDMKLDMKILAYDAVNTLVTTPPTLSSFDGNRWKAVNRKTEASKEQLAVSDLPDYFDLSDYDNVSYGDYRARFDVTYPSGKTETIQRFFSIMGA